MLVLFEVMDKEWPLWFVLLVYGVVGLVGFLLCRKRRRLIYFVLPVSILIAINQTLELNDRFVGAAIVKQAGLSYVVASYAAMAFSILCPVLGVFLRVNTPASAEQIPRPSGSE